MVVVIWPFWPGRVVGLIVLGFFVAKDISEKDFFVISVWCGFLALLENPDLYFLEYRPFFSAGTAKTSKAAGRGNPRALFVVSHVFCLKTNWSREFLFVSGNLPAGDLGFGKRSPGRHATGSPSRRKLHSDV